MHLSAIAYNLKKYLKFIKNSHQSIAGVMNHVRYNINRQMRLYIISFKQPIFLIKSKIHKN